MGCVTTGMVVTLIGSLQGLDFHPTASPCPRLALLSIPQASQSMKAQRCNSPADSLEMADCKCRIPTPDACADYCREQANMDLLPAADIHEGFSKNMRDDLKVGGTR